MARYGVKVGQIYLAADGSSYGHLVVDVDTFNYCDDAITVPFYPRGLLEPTRIDTFKLAMVRYYLAAEARDAL